MIQFKIKNITLKNKISRYTKGHLKTRKSIGSSGEIKIHFRSKFLMKYSLLFFQISGRLKIHFTK